MCVGCEKVVGKNHFNFTTIEIYFHETLPTLMFCLYKLMQGNTDFFGL